jgi:hypothetical protein
MKKMAFLLLVIIVLSLPAPALADWQHPPGQPGWAQWPGCPGGDEHCHGNWH